MIDVIVTSAGGFEEGISISLFITKDLIKCLANTFIGDFKLDKGIPVASLPGGFGIEAWSD
jgi:deoxyhypusine synthase